MRLLNQYIVEFETVHRTSTEAGGKVIDINPMYNQPKWINRIGRVIETPLNLQTPIQKGYEVLVVHTVLLEEILPKQGLVKNPYLLDEEKNWFQIEDCLIVMYRETPKDNWKCNGTSIMVEPIRVEKQEKEIDGITLPDMLFNSEAGYKGNHLQMGTIAYMNDETINMGLVLGDKIMFKKNREYEFEIDGKTYWHMENNDILMYQKTG